MKAQTRKCSGLQSIFGGMQVNRKWITFMAVLLTSMLLIAACGGNSGSTGNTGSSGSGGSGGSSPGSTGSGAGSSGGDDGPLSKYDPPITITMVRNLSDVVENNVLSVLADETFEDNRWSRIYEEQLGIKIKYDWVVKGNPDSDAYRQKMNVTLSSGDLPDVTPVDAIQLKQLVDAGLLEDMTDYYEKYASPLLKDILGQEGPAPFNAATYDGRLMAIPETGSNMESGMYLWVRMDWLEKLGLDPPKTMSDVRKISKAFAEQDPDGNGQRDTYGLALTKDLWGGFGGMEGFFAGFNAYPNIWIEGPDGKLVYGSIQPEVRQADRRSRPVPGCAVAHPAERGRSRSGRIPPISGRHFRMDRPGVCRHRCHPAFRHADQRAGFLAGVAPCL